MQAFCTAGIAFFKAMEKASVLSNADTANMTYENFQFARVMFIADLKTSKTCHPSEADSYTHYTTVYQRQITLPMYSK